LDEGVGVTVIVVGRLEVEAADRDDFIQRCAPVMKMARETPGCAAFALSPDPLVATWVNVYERWDDAAALEAFRGNGPTGDEFALVTAAEVVQYTVAEATPLA